MDHPTIRQLYHASLKQDADADGISRKTKADIEALLKDLKSEIQADDVFFAAAAAEENGFVKGFLHAFRLFTECAGK